MGAEMQDSHPLPEAVSDENLAGFIGDAAATISAEDRMIRGIADLLEHPFDASRQSDLAKVLTSPALAAANQAAARISAPDPGCSR
jgi:type II secretory pathway component HofQ